MKRARIGSRNGSQPVIVRGSPFTFRTLSPLDGLLPRNRPHRTALIMWESTFDREQTFTMPAIAGLYHFEPATTEVVL
jgi:hypothetical protein